MTLEMVYDGQFGSQTTVGSNICDAEGNSWSLVWMFMCPKLCFDCTTFRSKVKSSLFLAENNKKELSHEL